MADVNLRLNLQGLQESSKSIERFSRQSAKSLQSLSGAFNQLGNIVGFQAIQRGLSSLFTTVSTGVSQVIDAAAIQENAVNNLNQALISAGDFSEQASRGIQEFASSLQATTTVGDETILQLASIATAFTGSAEAAQELTAAAVDFAQGVGINAEEAVRRLGRATQGSTDDIAKFVPEIKNLTKEQLAAGEATRLIAERFQGSAAALRNTFSGAVQAATNSFGDFQEELGFLITQNPNIIRAVQAAESVFVDLSQAVRDNSDDVADFVLGVANGLGDAAQVFSSLARGATRAFIGIGDAFDFIVDKIQTGANLLTLVNPFADDTDIQAAVDNINAINQAAEAAQIESLKQIAAIDTFFNKVDQSIETVQQSLNEVASNASRAQNQIQSAGNTAVEQVNTLSKEQRSALEADFAKITEELKNVGLAQEEIFTNTYNERIRVLNQALDQEIINEERANQLKEQLALQLANNVEQIEDEKRRERLQKEVEAAKELESLVTNAITGGIKGFATAGVAILGQVIGGPLGAQIAASLFSILSQSRDDFKRFIDEAFSTEVIENVLANLGTLIGKVLNPVFLARLGIQIANALARGIVQGLASVVNSISNFFGGGDVFNIDDITFDLIPVPPDKSELRKVGDSISTIVDEATNNLSERVSEVSASVVDLAGRGVSSALSLLDTANQKLISGQETYNRVLDATKNVISKIASENERAVNELNRSLSASERTLERLNDELTRASETQFQGLLEDRAGVDIARVDSAERRVSDLQSQIADIQNELADPSVSRGQELILQNQLQELQVELASAETVLTDARANLAARTEELRQSFRFEEPPEIIAQLKAVQDEIDKTQEKITAQQGLAAASALAARIGGGFRASAASAEASANFATGGIVPPGFPNDTFRANLTSGELVVPRDDLDNIRQFINEERGGGSNQPIIVQLMLGEKKLAETLLQLNRQGLRTA